MAKIETERLWLRRWRDGDLGPYARICADPEVMRYLGGPRSREDCKQQLARFAAHWERWGCGLWAAEEKASGALVGRIGLMHHDEWHEGEGEREVEVGWLLARSQWGRGLATEGALASLGHGFDALGLARVISIVRPDNAASRRVMEKCGLTLRGASRFRGIDVVWYAIDGRPGRPGWRAVRSARRLHPDRARWGASGALHPQSAPAGLNPHPRARVRRSAPGTEC